MSDLAIHLLLNPSIFTDYYGVSAEEDVMVEKLMWDRNFKAEVEESMSNSYQNKLAKQQHAY